MKLLRKTYSDVILTTDIIVGFPGETEKEFEVTYQNLKEINFYKMHVFKYSKREGTKAATMPDQITPEKQEERSKKLINLSESNQKKYHEAIIGKNVEVLFEEQIGKDIQGHTQNYFMVKVKDKTIEPYQNQIKKVQLMKIENGELIGKI